MIAFALEKNPELRTIDLSRHTGLSYDDEKILINDVEKEIHANFINILWSSPRAKATVIIVGVIVVALHYIFKIVEIYKGFR